MAAIFSQSSLVYNAKLLMNKHPEYNTSSYCIKYEGIMAFSRHVDQEELLGSSCFYAAVTIHQQKLMTVKNNNQDTEEESSKANVQEDECAVSDVRLLSY